MTEKGEGVSEDPEADLRRDFTFTEEEKKSSRKTSGPKISPEVAAVGGAVAAEVGRRVFNKATEKAREALGTSRPKERAKRQKPGAGGGAHSSGGNPTVPPGSGEPPSGQPPDGGNREEEPKGLGDLNFEQIEIKLQDQNLSKEDGRYLLKRKERIIEDIKGFDDGDFIRDAASTFRTTLRNNHWDDVYSKLTEQGALIEDQLMRSEGVDKRWKGAMRQGFRAEAAKVLVAGIEHKEAAENNQVPESWYRSHNYTSEEVDRLKKIRDQKHVFDLAPDAPEEYVGKSLKSVEAEQGVVGSRTGPLSAEEYARMRRLRGESLQPVPLYFGAVFEGGKNEVHVARPEIIPILQLEDSDQRREFIFRNIHAFDYFFNTPTAWKGAIDDWIQDVSLANFALGERRINPTEMDKFLKELKAIMAVTASARAMEESTGVPKEYCRVLVGLDEKGNPNNDKQDSWDSFLLHADPNKLKLVLSNTTVSRYYRILMADAGLEFDLHHNEWLEYPNPDPDKKDEMVQIPSKLVWLRPDGQPAQTKEEYEAAIKLLREGRLARYLKNSAREGGFQKYIEDVLLTAGGGDEPREVRMAAARIACDAFMVDKYTRWEYALTGPERVSKKELSDNPTYRALYPRGEDEIRDLMVQPREDWGGDPFRSILQPTFLPRLKKVYQGEFEKLILDPVDDALRPHDYIDQILKARDSGGEPKYIADKKDVNLSATLMEDNLRNKVRLQTPSAVTNLKSYVRLSDAIYKVWGGSMATSLPKWRMDEQKEIEPIADLLNQVYGNMSVKERVTGKTVPVGKHMVAGMLSRIFKAKAQATTIESSRPDIEALVDTMVDPRGRERPLLEVLQLLFGPQIDGKAGFYYSLGHGRLEIKFRDNMFDVQQTHNNTWKMLSTNDQKGGHYAGFVEIGGRVIRATVAAGQGLGITGKR